MGRRKYYHEINKTENKSTLMNLFHIFIRPLKDDV